MTSLKRDQDTRKGISFQTYVTKNRWASYWHQLDEVLNLAPESVLEVGVGPRILSTVAHLFGVPLQTVDIEPAFKPDHVASILALPFSDKQFDISVAFQILEHLPMDDAMSGVRELVRVSRRFVIISVPDVQELWRYLIHIPWIGVRMFTIPRWRWRPRPMEMMKGHYWEVGRPGFSMPEVVARLEQQGVACRRTYRVFENSYHRFFVLEVRKSC